MYEEIHYDKIISIAEPLLWKPDGQDLLFCNYHGLYILSEEKLGIFSQLGIIDASTDGENWVILFQDDNDNYFLKHQQQGTIPLKRKPVSFSAQGWITFEAHRYSISSFDGQKIFQLPIGVCTPQVLVDEFGACWKDGKTIYRWTPQKTTMVDSVMRNGVSIQPCARGWFVVTTENVLIFVHPNQTSQHVETPDSYAIHPTEAKILLHYEDFAVDLDINTETSEEIHPESDLIEAIGYTNKPIILGGKGEISNWLTTDLFIFDRAAIVDGKELRLCASSGIWDLRRAAKILDLPIYPIHTLAAENGFLLLGIDEVWWINETNQASCLLQNIGDIHFKNNQLSYRNREGEICILSLPERIIEQSYPPYEHKDIRFEHHIQKSDKIWLWNDDGMCLVINAEEQKPNL